MTLFLRLLILSFFSLLLIQLNGCNSNKSASSPAESFKQEKILIFSKTMGWRHASIEEGALQLKAALEKKDMQVVVSEDASIFNEFDLSSFSALVFLNTTGDILNAPQQVAMERYIQAGGGYVGIHSATDTEREGDWFWYRRLVGGVFASHPNIPSNVQAAKIHVLNNNHPSTQHLPASFDIADEWYDFESLSDRRIDLLKVDEKTYTGGGHNGYHPIAWYHEFDGGRAFYTGIGHNADNFSDPLYMQHLLGAVDYAVGDNTLDYRKSRPEPNRFVKETLLDSLNEPVSLDITKDGSAIIFIERKGQVYWVDAATAEVTQIGKVDVFSAEGFGEFGLIALALDPNFANNRHLFLMYNVPSKIEGAGPLQRISRFTLVNGKLDLTSAVNMLDVPNDDTCCHTGGNMDFDAQGNLFIAMGDNTNPFKSFGSGPADFRTGEGVNDAYRSSGNTQDLRGKILRIIPQQDGSYTIPNGNLFTDSTIGKPEIYVMGTRNPYTMAFDDEQKILYFGDIGPDAQTYTDEHGPKGHDEINKVTEAGNFGWPLFIANNKAYRQFDYETNTPGKWNDPLNPRNPSPLNTGAKKLPAAQPAFIWYPYDTSEMFPELGVGGRNALVGGVYRTKAGPDALPAYYEGGLFITDFIRGYVKVVFSDKNGDIYKIEEFASEAEFAGPLDMMFSEQGQLYILEYGTKWHSGSAEARLSRVAYTGPGNRVPYAKIAASATHGAVPLITNVSGSGSNDPDNDPLTYSWQLVPLVEGQSIDEADYSSVTITQGVENALTLSQKGKYALSLTVSDVEGESHSATQLLEAGNAVPTIAIELSGNQSFIWPSETTSEYKVTVADLEDGTVTQDSDLFNQVHIEFIKQDIEAKQQAVGHLANNPFAPGRAASKKSLCTACHQEQEASVGPSFKQVADRYSSRSDALDYLKQTIAAGGGGKWGERQMAAHDFLSDNVRTLLGRYILSLKSKAPSLPLEGRLPRVSEQGNYVLNASYTDQGALGLSTIMTETSVGLRSPNILASSLINQNVDSDGVRLAGDDVKTMILFGEQSILALGEYDLSEVKAISLTQKYVEGLARNVIVELKTDGGMGDTISRGQFSFEDYQIGDDIKLVLNIEPLNKIVPLYLVTSAPEAAPEKTALNLFEVSFDKK